MSTDGASTVLEARHLDALALTPFSVTWVAETTSTNADLLRDAAAGGQHGLVLVADHQTQGRGRQGRRWEAPPASSLLVSALVRPGVDADHLHLITAAVGVAAAEAVEEVAGVTVGLKWPNDLVVPVNDGERKLGGILAEVTWQGHEPDAVIVGLGLNVDWPEEVPEELNDVAVSLDRLTDRPVDRRDLLLALLVRVDRWLDGLADPDGREALRMVWRRWSATLGRPVRVEFVGGDVLEGEATDLTPAGELVVTDAAGAPHVVRVGDVVHARLGKGPS